ncbi:MAG: extracellular solute-binding protein [Candidatus Caldatribacterium sp.]|nr:extracellular solute-binding protein [Candidatus Caldatribacterium sp.]
MIRKITFGGFLIVMIVGLVTFSAFALRSHVLYTWTGAEGTHVTKVADLWNEKFAEKYGFKVVVNQVGRDEFFSKMMTMIPSRTDTWQAFMVFNFYIPTFAEEGYILPLDKYYEDPAFFLPTYTKPLESALAMVSYKGSIYGFPEVVVSEGILRYRKDLIERLLSDEEWKQKYRSLSKEVLGLELEPKPPEEWMWDDYLAAAIFFTKKYNPDSPTEYGTTFQGLSTFGVQFAALFYEVLRSFGGDIIEDGKVTVNSPEGLKAISFILDLKNKYDVVPPDVHRYEAFENFAAFQSGNVAFGIDWDWDSLHLTDPQQSPLVWDKMAETIPPKGPAGRAAYIQCFAWVINNYTSEQAKEDMARFLAFASGSEEGVVLGLQQGIPPATYIPGVLSPEKGFDQRTIDHYTFYYESILSGKVVTPVFWPLVPGVPEIYTAISNALGRALAQEISYEEALKVMEEEIGKVIGK